MIGRVGDDESGRSLLARLEEAGVITSAVSIDPDHATGLAIITLDDAAENTIVVSPGANAHLSVAEIEASKVVLQEAAVTLVQLEVPLATVAATMAVAGGLMILNPAPAVSLPIELLTRVDVLVPNRSELASLTGTEEARTSGEAAEQAHSLRGPKAVVVTLGPEGAVLVQNGETTHVVAPTVVPRDTTGAGDAFCGALADALARGETIADAIRWAVHAGAFAATLPGAIASLPSAADIDSLMNGAR